MGPRPRIVFVAKKFCRAAESRGQGESMFSALYVRKTKVACRAASQLPHPEAIVIVPKLPPPPISNA